MPRRYVKAPWFRSLEQSDLEPQGDPETVVFLQNHGSLVGLCIRGVEGHVMLGIREDAHGYPLSCAVTNEIEIDTRQVQRNPNRAADTGED